VRDVLLYYTTYKTDNIHQPELDRKKVYDEKITNIEYLVKVITNTQSPGKACHRKTCLGKKNLKKKKITQNLFNELFW
jgi:hypothetical protein